LDLGVQADAAFVKKQNADLSLHVEAVKKNKKTNEQLTY